MNLQPIKFVTECCATGEEIRSNVEATLKRGYEGITEYLNGTNTVCSIVGAGASLADTYDDLRGHVIAVNSSLGFLLGKGIVPQMAMFWDASPLIYEFAIPHPDVTYLVCARCHPYVFERLKGCRVVVWFADGDHDVTAMLRNRGINEPMIKGGSAGVTRAMFLAFALGYRELHVYGADSSLSGSRTHVQGSLVPEDELTIHLTPDGSGPAFRTTPWLAVQALEHSKIVPMFRNLGAQIAVHGDGLLPYVHKVVQ